MEMQVHADPSSQEPPAAAALRHSLRRQRVAYLAQPEPSLAERRADLQQPARFVQDHRQNIVAATSADFGHRSTHATLLLAPIRQYRRHLPRWMQRRRTASAGVGHAA